MTENHDIVKSALEVLGAKGQNHSTQNYDAQNSNTITLTLISSEFTLHDVRMRFVTR